MDYANEVSFASPLRGALKRSNFLAEAVNRSATSPNPLSQTAAGFRQPRILNDNVVAGRARRVGHVIDGDARAFTDVANDPRITLQQVGYLIETYRESEHR